MTMIFRCLAILLGITCCIPNSVNAKIVSVDVTGYGENHKLAVVDGLKQAISQVSGVSISAEDTMSLSSIVSEDSENDDVDLKQKFSKEMQSGIATRANGYVSSYQIINSEKNDDGMYQVDLSVEIEKYETPGMDNNRRGIAVLGFKSTAARCFGANLGAEKQVEGITEALVSAFTATRKFSVLDRDNEDVYALEKSLVLSEDAKRSEVAKLGQVMGTDYIVTGAIKSLNINSSKQTIQLSGDVYTTYSASAEIDFRLLAFATRQVKFASSVRVSLSSNEIAGLGCPEVLSKLMKKASSQIVDKCIENIYPPLVVSVNNNRVYLNLGGEGIKKDSLYNVYSLGEKIIDPYTGESLGAEEVQIAVIKISEVKPKYSVGTVEEGNIADIQKGQICRFKAPAKREKAVAKKVKRQISEDEW